MLSRVEFRRRYNRLQGYLAQESLQAVLLVSAASIERRGYHRYLTNVHLTSRQSVGIVLAHTSPVMLVENESQQWRVRNESGLEDVRNVPHCGTEAAKTLSAHGVRSGVVGIAGMNKIMQIGDYLELAGSLPDVELRDVTAEVDYILSEKSCEELELMRESGVVADAGLETFTRVVAIGKTQREAVAEVERTVRARGAYATLMLMSAGPTTAFLDAPSGRKFAAGDAVTCSVELEGPSGYWVERAGMYSLGEPSDTLKRLHNSCVRALHAGAEALMPGNTAGDVARAVESHVEADGFHVGMWSGHGIGLNVRECCGISRDDVTVLREGMTIALHPHVQDGDGVQSAYISETFAVSARGGVSFSGLPQEFMIVG
jgi:Xaa-Pro aminopeptidase